MFCKNLWHLLYATGHVKPINKSLDSGFYLCHLGNNSIQRLQEWIRHKLHHLQRNSVCYTKPSQHELIYIKTQWCRVCVRVCVPCPADLSVSPEEHWSLVHRHQWRVERWRSLNWLWWNNNLDWLHLHPTDMNLRKQFTSNYNIHHHKQHCHSLNFKSTSLITWCHQAFFLLSPSHLSVIQTCFTLIIWSNKIRSHQMSFFFVSLINASYWSTKTSCSAVDFKKTNELRFSEN